MTLFWLFYNHLVMLQFLSFNLQPHSPGFPPDEHNDHEMGEITASEPLLCQNHKF